jgi:hypothetical protein
VLIARIYEVFPLLCPMFGGQMRIIAFITHSADIRQMLDHIGAESEPPNIAPARGPPLWEDCDAQAGEGSQGETDWDLVGQPAPDYEVDRQVNWWMIQTAIQAAFQMRCGVSLRALQVQHQLASCGFIFFSLRWLRRLKRQRSVAFECPKSVPYLASCD